MISKLKRSPTSGRKYFLAIHQKRTDKQNIQGTQKLNSPKHYEPTKWATELNRTFSKK
jgi:hypothetical protein